MRKAEFVRVLRERIGSRNPSPEVKRAMSLIVDECFSLINEELQRGNRLNLGRLGRFIIVELKKEGEEAGRKVVRFIPAKALGDTP